MLRAVPNPPAFIHGAMDQSVLSNMNVVSRVRDRMGELILRMPTNALSRHPYARRGRPGCAR